jgi:hypothetical protein
MGTQLGLAMCVAMYKGSCPHTFTQSHWLNWCFVIGHHGDLPERANQSLSLFRFMSQQWVKSVSWQWLAMVREVTRFPFPLVVNQKENVAMEHNLRNNLQVYDNVHYIHHLTQPCQLKNREQLSRSILGLQWAIIANIESTMQAINILTSHWGFVQC